jgi:hypothetical protein
MPNHDKPTMLKKASIIEVMVAALRTAKQILGPLQSIIKNKD